MKMKLWTICAVMISTSVLADRPAEPPAMTTPVPATKPASQPSGPSAELTSTPLVPGPAVVVANRVNLRGKAGLSGEVISQMTNGEPVTVIEEIDLKHSKANEPSAWAKIVLPDKAPAWVHSSYIDNSTMTVKPRKLNVRGGPGENFSILGTLQRGDSIKEIQTKGNWIQIEPPTNAYAFMAAQYLSQQPAVIAEATSALPPAETNNIATEMPQIATATTETPAETITNSTETISNEVAAVETPNEVTNEVTHETTTTNETEMTSETATPEVPAVEEPPPPRIVQREGIVRGTVSIQAPTQFELISPENSRPINYLYTTSTNLDLSRYKGLHIIVTGQEGIDRRWKNTPVLTIQRIQVLD
jgi:uncharacterized protein YgiM (DUF1202 family)